MVDTIASVVHGDKRTFIASGVLHVAGATAVAASFGAVLGGVGALAGAPWGSWSIAAIVAAACLYAAHAAGVPVPIPDRRKQVPDWWRSFYPAPLAALLYGAGLGIGFLTFLTFGTYVVVAVAAFAAGDPIRGALLCGSFGAARALAAAAGGLRARTTVAGLERLAGTPIPRAVNGLALAAVAGLGAGLL